MTAGTKEPHGLIASGRDCYILSKMNNRPPPSRAPSLLYYSRCFESDRGTDPVATLPHNALGAGTQLAGLTGPAGERGGSEAEGVGSAARTQGT